MHELEQLAADLGGLRQLIGTDRSAQLDACAAELASRLAGRRVWNINATATGGGVAEMLAMEVPYGMALGVDVRWAVLDGDAQFFAITKRLHNHLHGSPGDGGPLGEAERQHYEAVLAANARDPAGRVDEGDVLILHDPQPLGLVSSFPRHRCVWRCHIGSDQVTEVGTAAWDFLRRDVERCAATVFSRPAYVPSWLPDDRVSVIRPCIDPLSPKNRALPAADARAILGAVGLGPDAGYRPGHPPDVVAAGPPPEAGEPLVVQISRWDRLKDMAGVMEGFARYVPTGTLALVGPRAAGVTDDPEGADVWASCVEQWGRLGPDLQRRIRLIGLPMEDTAENATMVAAIQQEATVVTQKSLVEGFGLTVAEAMWKSRPVVASAVGGIVDQITDGVSGLLVNDPHDLPAFGALISRLLDDPDLRSRLGQAARDTTLREFLPDRSLLQWGELLQRLQG